MKSYAHMLKLDHLRHPILRKIGGNFQKLKGNLSYLIADSESKYKTTMVLIVTYIYNDDLNKVV